ncbi:MAG: universal stress protein [Campylobacteraceae bacterium]|nr:universal stress protein [Campylobacteraceae bacterium]
MTYKKLFFPIGGGEELEDRLYGALLIAKHFAVDVDILQSRLETIVTMTDTMRLPTEIQNSIDEVLRSQYKEEDDEFKALLSKVINKVGIDKSLVNLKIKVGVRSSLVEQASKFCDLVIAAAPPSGIATATFETAVLKSGKSVLMFPRVMKKFSLDSIIIGWNNSPEASRSLTSSLDLLKAAKKVKIVSSKEYIKDETQMKDIQAYLSLHGVESTYEIVKTTRIPGQALLNAANDGNFDLIVAGAFGQKGLRELMFGGTTRYLLENSTLPVFLSH